MCKTSSIFDVDTFRLFNEHKMLDGPLIERGKVKINFGGKIAAPDRKIGP